MKKVMDRDGFSEPKINRSGYSSLIQTARENIKQTIIFVNKNKIRYSINIIL